MFVSSIEVREVGKVQEVKQGIIKISGLPNCIYGQMIEIGEYSLKGMVVEFTPESVLGIIFGDENKVKVGDAVYSKGLPLQIPVGDTFIGRVIDVLGRPMDDRIDEIAPSDYYPVFRQAAGVMEREPVCESLQTGVKMIDLVIPIGHGQRELIVGDRQIGKTSVAVDAILNQKGKDVICIYCYIGGNHSSFKKTMQLFQQKGAMEYTLAVCASAGSSAAEQYICPYSASAFGEYFMYNGKRVLVVFDDLTKHAWNYRQMSLLMERAPGREAYPGDVFFLHSSLMERAGKLKKEFGGGTMTFLPIAETLQGDITGYIPSNLVSMTDGQIYMNSGLFQEGFRPAIDIELSVSRIGNKVQCAIIRSLTKGLRYVYVQYRSLLRLTRLRTKLSAEALQQLQRGKILTEFLTQDNHVPVSLAEEILLFYTFNKKILEAITIDKVQYFKKHFLGFFSRRDPELLAKIEQVGELDAEMKKQIDNIINDFLRESTPL